MDTSSVSLFHKIIAALAALTMTFSMAPLAWADDVPAGTAASMAAGNAASAEGDEVPDAPVAPEASAQSASTKAASSGSAGGTTVSIQVYRSSFPIVKWDLNDEDNALTDAQWAWADRTSELPERGTPGAAVEWAAPADYIEPTRSGFEFAGWSTDKSAPAGGYLSAEPKLTFPEGAPEGGEYTLYALWTPLEYAVYFELAKNPEVGEGPGSDASFALNWSTENDVRTVTDLSGGRYHVDGFTMAGADYDATTRTVKLPEPARTGYRFLGWTEADAASGVVVDGKDGFALNPVRLPQIDGIPVLTARWASAFGVTAPLSITFGDYDKTGAPDNPSMGDSTNAADDTMQSEADDVETPGLTDQERYEGLHAAYFENTGWAEPIRMVGIDSERSENAGDVLTTYDSGKASPEAVLGDGTAANPGERLLSLYPTVVAPADKSSGVHFRLSDSLAEDDLVALPSIAAGAQQPVTYGLNLSTDPVDGTPNHGLVLPTDDYERKQIATVSYTFAVGEAASSGPMMPAPTGSTSDALYVSVTDGFLSSSGLAGRAKAGVYGLADIKKASSDLSALGKRSIYYQLYHALLLAQRTHDGVPGSGPYFQANIGGTYTPVQLIGICQDVRTDGMKAGFTFQTRDIYTTMGIRSSNSNVGGWASSQTAPYSWLRTTFMGRLPSDLQASIAPVVKYQQLGNADTNDASTGVLLQRSEETIWITSAYEVFGAVRTNYNNEEGLENIEGYTPFQYEAFQGNDTTVSAPVNAAAFKNANGAKANYWLRSAYRTSYWFCIVDKTAAFNSFYLVTSKEGIVPSFCV